MPNDSETKLIIELIENTNKNTSDKFDIISQRFTEHVNDNKSDFNELKKLIKEDIKPVHDTLKKYDENLESIKKEQESFVKSTVCKINEEKINSFLTKVTKRVIYFNLIFLIVYVVLLYNSNIKINWPDFWGALVYLRRLFL